MYYRCLLTIVCPCERKGHIFYSARACHTAFMWLFMLDTGLKLGGGSCCQVALCWGGVIENEQGDASCRCKISSTHRLVDLNGGGKTPTKKLHVVSLLIQLAQFKRGPGLTEACSAKMKNCGALLDWLTLSGSNANQSCSVMCSLHALWVPKRPLFCCINIWLLMCPYATKGGTSAGHQPSIVLWASCLSSE